MALQRLQTELPGLYADFEAKQTFVADGAAGKVEFTKRDGRYKVLHKRGADGSILASVDATAGIVTQMMKRSGGSPEAADRTAAIIQTGGFNVMTEVAPGIQVIKRQVSSIEMKLETEHTLAQRRTDSPSVAILKTGYEYLALQIKEQVFDSWFDPIRHGLRTNHSEGLPVHVEPFRSKVRPLHALLLGCIEGDAVVTIRYFGAVVFRVRFVGLNLPPGFPFAGYMHDLGTGQDQFLEGVSETGENS